MHPLFKMAFDKTVQDTDGTCFAEPVTACHCREIPNANTRHVYRYCKFSGAHTPTPVKHETRGGLQNWRALLIESGREVRSL